MLTSMLGGTSRGRLWLGAVAACLVPVAFAGCHPEFGSHSFTISANPAPTGEPVEFSAQSQTFKDSSAKDLAIDELHYRWDLNGDGLFETKSPTVRVAPTGTTTTSTSRSYSQPGTFPVNSLVYTNPTGTLGFVWTGMSGGDTSVKGTTLRVTDDATAGPPEESDTNPNDPPLASFTVTPNPVEPHQQVVFDASSSSDRDGSIASYAWDLDQIPGFERDTGTNPRTSLFFDNRGTYSIGLRVIDDDGAVGTTTRNVLVRFSTDPRRVPNRATDLPKFEFSPGGRQVNEGVFQLNGDELLLSRAKARGTLPADGFPAPLRGSHDVRWAADYVVRNNIQTQEAETEAFVLLTFATGGRACLGVNVAGDGEGEPKGTFRVLGGIGKAARLRGLGTATGDLDDEGNPIVSGRGRFRLTDSPDYGLGKGRCGPLRRLAPQRG